MTMMRELNEDDFKSFNFSNMSPLEILVCVCGVARKISGHDDQKTTRKIDDQKTTSKISDHDDQKINLSHPLTLTSAGDETTTKKITTTACLSCGNDNAGLSEFSIFNFPTRKRSRISRNKRTFPSSDDVSRKKSKMQKKTNQKSSAVKTALAHPRRSPEQLSDRAVMMKTTSTTAGAAASDNDTAGLCKFGNVPTRKRSRTSRNMPTSSSSDVVAAHHHQEHDHDGDQGDRQQLVKSKKQKKTNKKSTTAKTASAQARRRPNLIDLYWPDLPQLLRDRIQELQGTNINLVIQKKLYSTDLTQKHNRLLMPFNQIISADFLAQEEKDLLRTKHTVEVPVMIRKTMEEVEEIKLVLRQWDMKKPNGRTSHNYVLRTHWYRQVVKGQGMVPGQVMQVWSFRVHRRLRLALVLVSGELQA